MEDFQLFVKPVGAACNLACAYCYYPDILNQTTSEKNPVMSDDLLEMYLLQHFDMAEGPDIFFSWHGGEPTVAGLEFFRRVIELQKKHNVRNFRIINGLQTNGTLLNDAWCHFLKANGFIVGISMDGPESLHSQYRFHKNGRSVFEEVMRGYHLLKRYEIPCEILCVVNSSNVQFPHEVYQFFKQLKTEFITFIPLVEKIDPVSGLVSDRSVPAKAFGEFLCTIFDEWKSSDIGTVKIQIFEEALRTAFAMDHTLCIFKKTCGGVPVLEKNGDIYSCDHFVNQDNLLGNIRDTSLAHLLSSEKQQAFGQAKFTMLPDYCRTCEVLSFCHGACPKDRIIDTPDGQNGLNYLCEGYKLFFNHCKPFVDQVAEVWRQGQ